MWSPSLELNFLRTASTSSRRAGGLYSTVSTDSRDTMLKISSEQEKLGDNRMVCEREQTRQASVTPNSCWVMCVTHVALWATGSHILSEPHNTVSICVMLSSTFAFTLAYLGSRGKLAIFFPRAVRKTCPSFLSTAPSSSKCSTAERTASGINKTGYYDLLTLLDDQGCTVLHDQ